MKDEIHWALKTVQEHIGYSFRDTELLLQALTHKSWEHENPSFGHPCNERMEFLGDAVLSLIISEKLYSSSANPSEAVMSKVRSSLVKGPVLANIALELDIGRCLLLGKGELESGGREKKSIVANALEAIIGAVYLDGGISDARSMVLELFGGRIDSAFKSVGSGDYKSELQELCQTLYGTLPQYTLVGEEGAEHEKVFSFEVTLAGKIYGQGAGRSKKEAQNQAALRALKAIDNDGSLGFQ